MARQHLFRRGAVYYWRRRLPAPLAAFFRRKTICISTRTRDPRIALRRGARLTVLSDTLSMGLKEIGMNLCDLPECDLSPETRAQVLKRVFDTALEEGEELLVKESLVGDQDRSVLQDAFAYDRLVLQHSLRTNFLARGLTALEEACAELGTDIVPDSLAYHRLGRDSLRLLVRASDILAERREGRYPEDEALTAPPLPVADGSAPRACPPEPLSPTDTPPVPSLGETPPPLNTPGSDGTPPARERKRNPNLDLRLSEAFPRYIAERQASAWGSAKTTGDAERAQRFVIDILGDVTVGEIDEDMADEVREKLLALPALNGRGIYAGLSPNDAIALINRLETEAKAKPGKAKTQPSEPVERKEAAQLSRLSLKTVNKYLSNLHDFCEWCRLRGDRAYINPFDGTLFSKEAVNKQRRKDKRRPFTQDELNQLFTAPIWSGWSRYRHIPGSRIEKDHYWWLPLLGALTGARVEEICTLAPDDVYELDGRHFIRIHDDDGKQLKSPAARRIIPVHRRLEQLGFLSLVREARRKRQAGLFPDLKPGGPDMRFSNHYSKRFGAYLDKLGLHDPKLVFHSFRHNFNTLLARQGVTETLRSHLLGHKREVLADKDYFGGFQPQELAAALDKLTYLDALHFPSQLGDE